MASLAGLSLASVGDDSGFLTENAQKLVDCAIAIATSQRCMYVGTEHYLVSISRARYGKFAREEGVVGIC